MSSDYDILRFFQLADTISEAKDDIVTRIFS